MRYFVLACDYDGTLANDGAVEPATIRSLERLSESGRKLVLVTGRELSDLLGVFPQVERFDGVVAENGAVLYEPATRKETVLAAPPPGEFAEMLRVGGVHPFSSGRVILATRQPYETEVLAAIRRLGLELQVIFNKGAVMILPSGVNKATGLAAALDKLNLSPHNAVAVGDGENDHALLTSCEASAAVANAVPMLGELADIVLPRPNGAGVRDLIDAILADDLMRYQSRLTRHHIYLGDRQDGTPFSIPPYAVNFLIAGSSGAGKSTVASAFLERLLEKQYQFCVIDPEGDYVEFPHTVPVGSSNQPPEPESVLRVLDNPRDNAVVSLVGVALADRPAQFVRILTRLQELRARTGRPHWILIDEAHHVLPAAMQTSSLALPEQMDRTVFLTLEPDLVATTALAKIDLIVAAGKRPEQTLRVFAHAVGDGDPQLPPTTLEHGELIVWPRRDAVRPFHVRLVPGQLERRRHHRKYAEGELEPDRSFYFRGPQGRLNLRAQNLILFLQLAEGIDDETWIHHLRRGDYSQWFREGIKDPRLAEEAERIEAADLAPEDSRQQIRELVEQHYTLGDSPFRVVPVAAASTR